MGAQQSCEETFDKNKPEIIKKSDEMAHLFMGCKKTEDTHHQISNVKDLTCKDPCCLPILKNIIMMEEDLKKFDTCKDELSRSHKRIQEEMKHYDKQKEVLQKELYRAMLDLKDSNDCKCQLQEELDKTQEELKQNDTYRKELQCQLEEMQKDLENNDQCKCSLQEHLDGMREELRRIDEQKEGLHENSCCILEELKKIDKCKTHLQRIHDKTQEELVKIEESQEAHTETSKSLSEMKLGCFGEPAEVTSKDCKDSTTATIAAKDCKKASAKDTICNNEENPGFAEKRANATNELVAEKRCCGEPFGANVTVCIVKKEENSENNRNSANVFVVDKTPAKDKSLERFESRQLAQKTCTCRNCSEEMFEHIQEKLHPGVGKENKTTMTCEKDHTDEVKLIKQMISIEYDKIKREMGQQLNCQCAVSNTSSPCQGERAALVECYKKHPNETILCEGEVRAFVEYVVLYKICKMKERGLFDKVNK